MLTHPDGKGFRSKKPLRKHVTSKKDAYLCPVIKRNALKEEDTLVPYTMEEVEVMLDETEINSYDGMDKEFYTPEEAYELIMRDIRAIYEMKDSV